MRWLFLLLLSANLAILVWGLQRAPLVTSQRPAPAASAIGNLRLISEEEPGKEAPATPQTTEVPAATELSPAGAITAGEPAPEIPAAAPGIADLALEALPAADPAPWEDAPNEAPNETAAPEGLPQVAASSPGPLPDREIATPALSEPQSGNEFKPEPEPEPEPVVLVCGALGPFERGAEARGLVESLAGQGLDTSLRRESMEKPIGFWVMIPPLPTREAALEKVEQLRASGVEDVRRFVKGDQVNGISLGVFSSENNARSRQRAVAEKGHRSSVVPRLIMVPTYWVDYRADRVRADKAVARITDNQDGIKNEQYPCPRVVTSGGIF